MECGSANEQCELSDVSCAGRVNIPVVQNLHAFSNRKVDAKVSGRRTDAQPCNHSNVWRAGRNLGSR